jgi:hypothetical protein
MSTLKEDIEKGSVWISQALNTSGYKADFSKESLSEVERFFTEHTKEGKPVEGGLLSEDTGNRLFCLGAYVGETLRKITGGEWGTDDADPEGELNSTLKLPNGTIIWPMQRVAKRLINGPEDSIKDYALRLI